MYIYTCMYIYIYRMEDCTTQDPNAAYYVRYDIGCVERVARCPPSTGV